MYRLNNLHIVVTLAMAHNHRPQFISQTKWVPPLSQSQPSVESTVPISGQCQGQDYRLVKDVSPELGRHWKRAYRLYRLQWTRIMKILVHCIVLMKA